MPLQIMQNLYPASWLYLTGHCYVRSMCVKHHFVSLVVCLFVAATFYYYHHHYYFYYLLLLLFIYFFIIIIFNWYKLELDCKLFVELCKFFKFQIFK